MTITEKLYQLIPTLTEQQRSQLLGFAESLQQQPSDNIERQNSNSIVNSLRGIAKPIGPTPTDPDPQEDYIDYLERKYQ